MADSGDDKDIGHKWHSAEVRDAFYHILDTFSGGNSDFTALLFLVRELDDRAANGDAAAAETLKTVVRMSKLIGVAQKVVFG